MARQPRRMRSAELRFALIYAFLWTASAVALAGFVWWSTAGLLERQIDAAITADEIGLQERYDERGLRGLKDTIDQRIFGNVDDDAIYLLLAPDMTVITGNYLDWPRFAMANGGWYKYPLNRAGIHTKARLHQISLPGGYHLLIGRDVQFPSQVAGLVGDAMLWAAMIVVVLGTIGAIAVRRLFRMTLADISATATAISAGDFTRRVRVTGRGDEFDRLAETINDMLDRITRLMDGVRQVSNAIAHDLRTPITRARARLEDANRPDATEADLRASIERGQADLDGIVRVFQALLRIAEIESGSRRSEFATIDVAPLLDDMADLYEAVAEEREQRFVRAVPGRLPATGDREMIQQAVANLLENALKFSPPGGMIWLSAGIDAGSRVRVVVADQGPGIPPGDRARATERFFRGEAARNTPGSGLGLTLVHAVATLHGGTLSLEDNAPGLRAVLLIPGATEGAPASQSRKDLDQVSPQSQNAVTAAPAYTE